MVFISILIFIIALGVLVYASDKFTDFAEKIGLKSGISSFVIGITIVALGTSLPELISSIFAVQKGVSEVVIGNVVGSNIANVLLIVGFVGVLSSGLRVKRNIFSRDFPLFFVSLLYVAFVSSDGVITFFEGLFGIIGIFIFLYLSVSQKDGVVTERKKVVQSFPLLFFFITISGIAIFYSAQFLVDSIIDIATFFSVGPEIIAITIVAFGTSLPELAVGLQAIRRNNAGLLFGNIIGSTIFNSFGVLGISALFGVLTIPSSILYVSIPFMMFTSILFYLFLRDKIIIRREAIIFLTLYIAYILLLFLKT